MKRFRSVPISYPEQLSHLRQLGSYQGHLPPVYLDGKEDGRLAPTDIHARAWFVGYIHGRAARGLSARFLRARNSQMYATRTACGCSSNHGREGIAMRKKAQPRDIDPTRLASGNFRNRDLEEQFRQCEASSDHHSKVILDLGTEIDADEKTHSRAGFGRGRSCSLSGSNARIVFARRQMPCAISVMPKLARSPCVFLARSVPSTKKSRSSRCRSRGR